VITLTFKPGVQTTIAVHVKPRTPILSTASPPTWVRGTNGLITVSATGLLPDATVFINGVERNGDEVEELPGGQLRVEVFIEETADATGPLRFSVRIPRRRNVERPGSCTDVPHPDRHGHADQRVGGKPGVVVTINAPPGLDEPYTLYPVTKVRFAGTEIPATYINHKQMTATIPPVCSPRPGRSTSHSRIPRREEGHRLHSHSP
jgi:hypothetical protein